jgi:hypothetical protein
MYVSAGQSFAAQRSSAIHQTAWAENGFLAVKVLNFQENVALYSRIKGIKLLLFNY